MTALLTRMRPLVSHPSRIRRPLRAARTRSNLRTAFAAADERLATLSELELLRIATPARIAV